MDFQGPLPASPGDLTMILNIIIDGIGDACATLSGEGTGLIGVGTVAPHSKFQVEEGDIYVENIYRGIILRSGNGTCYRIKPNDEGVLITTEIKILVDRNSN